MTLKPIKKDSAEVVEMKPDHERLPIDPEEAKAAVAYIGWDQPQTTPSQPPGKFAFNFKFSRTLVEGFAEMAQQAGIPQKVLLARMIAKAGCPVEAEDLKDLTLRRGQKRRGR